MPGPVDSSPAPFRESDPRRRAVATLISAGVYNAQVAYRGTEPHSWWAYGVVADLGKSTLGGGGHTRSEIQSPERALAARVAPHRVDSIVLTLV